MDTLKKQFIKSNIGINCVNTYDSPAIRLTEKIDDREIFMKGIDYSYYYEEE